MPQKNDSFAALMTVAQDQQSYFTTKQAIEAGYADNTHPYHVRAGNWERVCRGIYRMAHFLPPEDGEMMAWLLWSRGRDEKPVGAMSHQTALSLFELGDFNPAKVHMSVPETFRRNRPTPKAVVLHQATLAPAEVTRLRGLIVCPAAGAVRPGQRQPGCGRRSPPHRGRGAAARSDHRARTFSDERATRPSCRPLNDVFDWICAHPSFRLADGPGSHRKAAAQAQRPQEI